ncbi:hypothetical protein PTKIN_Ptkin11bG0164300 [Pterospermum kingtungense]
MFRVVIFLTNSPRETCFHKIEEVNKIYEKGSFSEGVAVDGPPAVRVTLPPTILEGEIDVKERIWELLTGDEVGMIGVCGMGGIGKTTIMKQTYQ